MWLFTAIFLCTQFSVPSRRVHPQALYKNQHSCFSISPGIQEPPINLAAIVFSRGKRSKFRCYIGTAEWKQETLHLHHEFSNISGKQTISANESSVLSQCLALTTQTLSASGGLDFSITTYQVPEEYLKSIPVSSGYDLSEKCLSCFLLHNVLFVTCSHIKSSITK